MIKIGGIGHAISKVLGGVGKVVGSVFGNVTSDKAPTITVPKIDTPTTTPIAQYEEPTQVQEGGTDPTRRKRGKAALTIERNNNNSGTSSGSGLVM